MARLFGGVFHDFLDGPWEEARGFLKEELEQLRAAIQRADLGDSDDVEGRIEYENLPEAENAPSVIGAQEDGDFAEIPLGPGLVIGPGGLNAQIGALLGMMVDGSGSEGEQGPPGKDGIVGRDGAQVIPIFWEPDAPDDPWPPIPGPQGPTGAAGADGSGAGTVTNTEGALTDHAVIVGNGGDDVAALPSLGSTENVLFGNASGDPSWAAPAVPLVLSDSMTIPTDRGMVVPSFIEVPSGLSLEIADEGVLEVLGPAYPAFSGARVYTAVNVSVPDQTNPYPLPFDTEEYDTDSYHSTATNNERLIIPVTGYYRMSAGLSWAANVTGLRRIYILKNGVLQAVNAMAFQDCPANVGGAGTNHAISIGAYLRAGDYVQVGARQTSTANLNANGTAANGVPVTFFEIQRVG